MLTGRCHCGGVKYEAAGAVVRFSNCHCEDCRRICGSPFSAAVVLEREGFRITQGENLLTAYESSPGKFRCFCSRCSSPIYAHMTHRPTIVIIRAGTLDRADGLAPQMHIWVNAKAPWHEILDDLPQYPEGYVQK